MHVIKIFQKILLKLNRKQVCKIFIFDITVFLKLYLKKVY